MREAHTLEEQLDETLEVRQRDHPLIDYRYLMVLLDVFGEEVDPYPGRLDSQLRHRNDIGSSPSSS